MSVSIKRITDFRVSWTADHEQYWQGHGIAFADYTHCATGCGSTLREAFEDALEDLCQQDIDLGAYHVIHEKTGESKMLSVEQEMLAELTSQVKEPEMLDMDIVQAKCPEKGEHKRQCHACDGATEECETCEGEGELEDEDPDCAVCDGEWHFYVSIDVKVEGERG